MDVEELQSMSVEALLQLRRKIDEVLSHRRDELEHQLELITGKRNLEQPPQARFKPQPAYQSRKNPDLLWTGRGHMPRWMREEIRGTKMTKEDFRINGRKHQHQIAGVDRGSLRTHPDRTRPGPSVP